MGERRFQGDYSPVDAHFSGSSQFEKFSGMTELVFVASDAIRNEVH